VSGGSSTARCERYVDNTNTGDEVTLEGHSNEQSQDGEDPPQLGVLVSDYKIKNNAVTTSVDTS